MKTRVLFVDDEEMVLQGLGDVHIDVAVELRLISSGIQKFTHSVRAYRNLIHPAHEVRTGMRIGEEEAKYRESKAANPDPEED